MKCKKSKILILLYFVLVLFSCSQKKDLLDEIWNVDYCKVESVYNIFEKLGFKNNGKRLERKITDSMLCHVQVFSPSLIFIKFWESDCICISEENQKIIKNSLIRNFGDNIENRTLYYSKSFRFRDIDLSCWETEKYFVYIANAYELFGDTECFENYGVIIQIKDFSGKGD